MVVVMLIMVLALILVFYGTSSLRESVVFDGSPMTADPSELQHEAHLMTDKRRNNPYLHGRTKHQGTWWAMKQPMEGYTYSAFYDDRKSLGTLPVIRIIAVMENIDNRDIYCLVWYEGRPAPIQLKVHRLAIGAGISRHSKNFKEYVLTCKLNDEDIPDNVSLIINQGDKPSFIMPVEVPERPNIKDNFSVCVSVSYWKQDIFRIVEWMEILKLFGVSKVTIYNNSLEAEPSRIFQYYDDLGFIDFRQSHSFVDDPGELTQHMHMSPVINDCMYRNMHRYRKIVVTDLDELIVPRTTNNYADMLSEIDKVQASAHPAKHYVFQNDYFFFDIPGCEDPKQSKHLQTLHFRKRLPPSPRGYSVKSMIDPQACTNMHNHYCWGLTKLYDTNGNSVDVNTDLAMNYHYKKCHFDKWERPGRCAEMFKDAIQDDTMLRFEKELKTNVYQRFKALNLDPSS